MAMALKFDPIEYTKQLRSVGVSQEQADIQAQTIERIIDNFAESQNLATKQDLKLGLSELRSEMVQLRLELIKWVLGTGAATVVALAGLLKFMH